MPGWEIMEHFSRNLWGKNRISETLHFCSTYDSKLYWVLVKKIYAPKGYLILFFISAHLSQFFVHFVTHYMQILVQLLHWTIHNFFHKPSRITECMPSCSKFNYLNFGTKYVIFYTYNDIFMIVLVHQPQNFANYRQQRICWLYTYVIFI